MIGIVRLLVEWVCPECGTVSTWYNNEVDRYHDPDCSWLYGLDAKPDGSYNGDRAIHTG